MSETKSETKRGSFTSSIGFILAAAGSAVGLGNLWRFPYLAAKDGGGLFLVVYLILALTFGFALMTTEIAIGRKTRKSPLTAYGAIDPHFKWLGWVAGIVPTLILPYYCVIGGWVCKYAVTYLSGNGMTAADPTGGFFHNVIGAGDAVSAAPIIWLVIYVVATAIIVYFGVEKGIENFSKVLMPILLVLIVGIAAYSITLKDPESGRTALQGLKIYLVPSFKGMTVPKFFGVVLDAVSQLFYSLSLAMGIMITYGSYMKKESTMSKSVNRIEIFDTFIAFMAGFIMVPAVFCFLGNDGLTAAGPSLMFIALPQVFASMGFMGHIIGSAFFILVIFAALTSSVSIMEAVVSMLMDKFKLSRHTSCLIVTAVTLVLGVVTCLGYNAFYFEATFASVVKGQILDIFDWFTNYLLMPIVAIATCVLIGWVAGTDKVVDEVKLGGKDFKREKLYVVMTKYVSPILHFLILLSSFGVFNFLG